MRIRYVLVNAYGRGGTVRTTLSMASALADRGHDVEVASLRQTRHELQYPVSARVRVASLTGIRPRRSAPGRPGAALRYASRVALRRTSSRLAHPRDRRAASLTLAHDWWLRRWVERQDDAVVVSTQMTLNLALATLRTHRQVALAQEHNHLAAAADIRASYAASYPSLDALAVLTERDAADYRALLGTRPPVLVVPNALAHRIRLRRSPLSAQVVAAAGSLVHRKGFDLLVQAWGLVGERHPDWSLCIHGEGPLREELAAQVEAAGLSGRVSLAGFQPDLASRLHEASVFVLSSRAEGLPLVIIEAMAAGLPVVAFDCPTGPADLLQAGRSGILVPPGDVAGLAEALTRVIEDESLRRSLADASAARARDFDVATTASRWEGLFETLADERGLSVGRPPRTDIPGSDGGRLRSG